MTNPLESLTSFWMKSITEATSNQNPMQQWQKAAADFWQTPATYWQNVATMMTQGNSAAQNLATMTPQMMQKMASSKSFPEFVGNAMAVQAELASQLFKAGVTSATYRNAMAREIFTQATRNMPDLSGWTLGSTPAVDASAKAQQPEVQMAAPAPKAEPKAEMKVEIKAEVKKPEPKKPEPAPFVVPATPKAESPKPVLQKPVVKLFKPAEAPQAAPAPSVAFTAQPVVSAERGQRKPLFTQMPTLTAIHQPAPAAPTPVLAVAEVSNVTPIHAPVPENNPEIPLLTGTTGAPVISSTADSVMRSSAGATIAAAAAARRSVVARRQSRSRRPR